MSHDRSARFAAAAVTAIGLSSTAADSLRPHVQFRRRTR
jgi:hypothetical protein